MTGPSGGVGTRAAARVRSGARDAVRALREAVVGFYTSDDLTFASSIAFFSLLSLFPCLLLLLALLGQVAASPEERAAIVGFLLQYFPRQFDFLTAQLDLFSGERVRLGVAGSLVTIWAALGVFGAITTAVNHAWRVDRHPSYFKHKLVSFLMLLAAGALTFVGLLFVSLQNLARASRFAQAIQQTEALAWVTGLAAQSAAMLLFIVVVGLVFYFVPNTRVRFRDVWIGAVLTGVLWRAALAGFSWYVRDLSRFSIHGSIAAVVVFLIWVYLWSVILLFGAEYTAAYARLRASGREP